MSACNETLRNAGDLRSNSFISNLLTGMKSNKTSMAERCENAGKSKETILISVAGPTELPEEDVSRLDFSSLPKTRQRPQIVSVSVFTFSLDCALAACHHATCRRFPLTAPRATCVPRLLDGLHPLVAVTLLLGSQLQRLLSIVTKYDEEVVLKRQKQSRRGALYSWH